MTVKVSDAVLDAAAAFSTEGGGTYLDFAQRAQVSYAAAQNTVKNLVRSGKLCAVERRQVAGIAKPLHVYVPAQHYRRCYFCLDDEG